MGWQEDNEWFWGWTMIDTLHHFKVEFVNFQFKVFAFLLNLEFWIEISWISNFGISNENMTF